MERRGWSWKKKITEKIAAARSSTDSSLAIEFNQENELLDKAKVSDVVDARLKILNSQLAAKEELVQQHAKVAEEAVTGWEKAESDAATMKKQLDAEVQKRLATEDRVSHLDGALKECMRQLRLVREEQEEKIHEALTKNTREWEIVREEMEVKLGEKAKELMAAGAERAAMGKLLQERARSIMEANEWRERAEAEMKVLLVKLEVADKETAKWKYEVQVVTKELEIRNEELEFNKKTADASNKQHVENVKKVAKLESECQRLRLLVRKRLPGPAAVAQMRMEVEALGTLPLPPLERGRVASPSRRNSNPSFHHLTLVEPSKELSDRLFFMEHETKSLKDALIKKTDELHAARLMFAHTATKLSTAEEQLEYLSRTKGFPVSNHSNLGPYVTPTHIVESCQEPSIISLSENGGDESNCVESWSTAMVTGLAQSEKEKRSSATELLEDSSRFSDLMYDFAEMEKLASMPPESHLKISEEESTKVEGLLGLDDSRYLSSLETPHVAAQMQEEKSEKTQLEGLESKLSHTEDDLNAIKLENFAVKEALLSTEKRLLAILQFESDATHVSDVLERVRAAFNAMQDSKSKCISGSGGTSYRTCLETEPPEVRDIRVWSPSAHSSCQSEESTFSKDAPAAPPEKVIDVGPELAAAVHKMVSLVESLSDLDCSEWDVALEKSNSPGHPSVAKRLRNLEFGSCVRSLITLCNGVLDGKFDIIDFLVEMASALGWLVSHIFSLPSKLPETTFIRRRLEWKKASIDASESDTLGAVTSQAEPMCRLSNLKNDEVAGPVPQSIGESLKLADCKELHSFASEKSLLVSNLEVYMKKFQHVENEAAKLKLEKEAAENNLKLMMEDVEHLKSQLQASKIKENELQSQFTTALGSKQSLLNEVAELVSSQNFMETQLNDAREEIKKYEEITATLEVQLQDETQCRKDIEAMLQELQDQQARPTVGSNEVTPKDNEPSIPDSCTDELAANPNKQEQEIAAAAEKLAECQQNILILGKQLKALGVPHEGSICTPSESKNSSIQVSVCQHGRQTLCDHLQGVNEDSGALHTRFSHNGNTIPMGFQQSRGEEEGGSEHERWHTESGKHGSSCSPQLSPIMYRSNGLVSPYYCEAARPASSPRDSAAISSAGLSSPRNRVWDSSCDSSSEKSASGFSRFFSRNRAAR